jgi:hypothetical protein
MTNKDIKPNITNFIKGFCFSLNKLNIDSLIHSGQKEYSIRVILANTIVTITNDGNLFYITKNFKSNTINYEYVYKGEILNIKKQFIRMNKNKKSEIIENKYTLTIKQLIEKNNNQNIGIYDYCDFIPYNVKKNTYDLKSILNLHIFNIFTSLHIKSVDVQDNNDDIIKPILFHIKEVLCNNDVNTFDYIIKWLTTLFQKPRTKFTCLIFISEKQGVGKTGFLQWIVNNIVDEQYCVICDMDKVLTRFNSILNKNLLYIFNKVKNYHIGFIEIEKFKSLITNTYHVIENKCIDCRKVHNYSKFIITTNNYYPIVVHENDRRFCFIECSNGQTCNRTYFEQLYGKDLNQNSVKSFYNYLMNVDFDG